VVENKSVSGGETDNVAQDSDLTKAKWEGKRPLDDDKQDKWAPKGAETTMKNDHQKSEGTKNTSIF